MRTNHTNVIAMCAGCGYWWRVRWVRWHWWSRRKKMYYGPFWSDGGAPHLTNARDFADNWPDCHRRLRESCS